MLISAVTPVGDPVVAEVTRLEQVPGDGRHHRPGPHRLVEKRLEVVVVAAAHRLPGPAVHLRESGEALEGPRDGVGGGLVAGQQQRYQLVADLAVRERCAVLGAGLEEQCQDVVAGPGVAGVAPFVDHREYAPIDPAQEQLQQPHRILPAGVHQLGDRGDRRRGDPEQAQQLDPHGGLRRRHRRRLGQPEDPGHDHVQRDLLSDDRQRYRTAHRPRAQRGLGRLVDGLLIRGHRSSVESRHQQCPLLAVPPAERGQHRLAAHDRPQR